MYSFVIIQYRSLRFEYENLNQEFYQQRAQVNFPNEFDYTRITEPKHATGQSHEKTTIIREYPTWEGEGYYPVPTSENQQTYAEYQKLAQELEKQNIFFVGRLATYKYINMDQAFANALELFYNIEDVTRD